MSREARVTLAECRASCRELYRHLAPDQLPAMVQLFGGLGDSVTDGFGFQYDLCNPHMGFTSSGRWAECPNFFAADIPTQHSQS